MKSECRHCGRVYSTSHAEYYGYCKQGCLTAKAKILGWSAPRGSKDGLFEVLSVAGEIGDVPVPNELTLYHGTSTKCLDGILAKGILPRLKTGRTNYPDHLASRDGMVYLSSEYPVFYANNAAGEQGGDPVILQVSVSTRSLYPDEDFLAPILARGDYEKEMSLIKEVDVKQYKRAWRMSLDRMGNVCTPRIKKDQILNHHVFGGGSISLQLALGLDTNPSAPVRMGIPIHALRDTRGYQGLLEILFASGPEAVLAEVAKQQEALLSQFSRS